MSPWRGRSGHGRPRGALRQLLRLVLPRRRPPRRRERGGPQEELQQAWVGLLDLLRGPLRSTGLQRCPPRRSTRGPRRPTWGSTRPRSTRRSPSAQGRSDPGPASQRDSVPAGSTCSWPRRRRPWSCSWTTDGRPRRAGPGHLARAVAERRVGEAPAGVPRRCVERPGAGDLLHRAATARPGKPCAQRCGRSRRLRWTRSVP